MYSIAINTDVLQSIKQDDSSSNASKTYETKTKNIMQDIKNNVREIMESI